MDLVQPTQYPKFDLLGLLLGGRPYAAQHFGTRAQIDLQNQEESRRASFADKVMASPEMAAANANPYDRKGQWGLWGAMQHGPESAAKMGADYMSQMIGATNQRDQLVLDDELSRRRIMLTADQQIRVAERSKAIDAAAEQQRMQLLFGPSDTPGMSNAQQQAMRNLAFKQMTGQDLPSGMDAVPTENGLSLVPQLGSQAWREMATEFQDVYAVGGLLNDLAEQARSKNGGKGEWETVRATLMDRMRMLAKAGTLDAGLVEHYNKMIPDRWDGAFNPMQQGIVDEKLRVLINDNKIQVRNLQDKWQLPADRAALIKDNSRIRRSAKNPEAAVSEPTDADWSKADRLMKDREAATKAEKDNMTTVRQKAYSRFRWGTDQ